VGVRRPLLGDAYQDFIRARWSTSLSFVAVTYLAGNLLFALGYRLTGGIANARSFTDLFFFSVQTSATIGYGVMYPQTRAAHVLVVAESMIGIFLIALMTGLLFAKFSNPRARVRFATHPVIMPFDGVPTLMFRLGNQRDSRLIEATLRVVLIRTEHTREGVLMYRMYDLPLERERSPALSRSWMAMHRILPGSPLHGTTPESAARDEVELTLTLTGIDEVSAQAMHAQTQYVDKDIKWGMRYADMLSERADGGLRLDMVRFDDLVPAPFDGTGG